jgi:sorbitol-specific phosphotransferase system component IIC
MMATILGIMQAGVSVVVIISLIVVLLVIVALIVRAVGHHRENKANSPSSHGGNGHPHDQAA